MTQEELTARVNSSKKEELIVGKEFSAKILNRISGDLRTRFGGHTTRNNAQIMLQFLSIKDSTALPLGTR